MGRLQGPYIRRPEQYLIAGGNATGLNDVPHWPLPSSEKVKHVEYVGLQVCSVLQDVPTMPPLECSENVERSGPRIYRVIWDLSALAALLERLENVKRAGLWARLRLHGWLWVGLRALFSASAPPERLENVKRAGLWVRRESRDLSAMIPPRILGKCQAGGAAALSFYHAPPRMLGKHRAGGAAGALRSVGPSLRHAPPRMLRKCRAGGGAGALRALLSAMLPP